MIRLLLILLLLFTGINSYCQTITLIDQNTRRPIENVYIFGSNHSVITNQEGKALLDGFSKKEDLFFQHPAYQNIKLSFTELQSKQFCVSLQSNVLSISEIIISANKWEQNTNEIPIKVIQLDREKIERSNAQTSADLLKESKQVYIQKSQLGGGSPMIRGFAANRVLLILDGVRLNNAIYRSGNLQNVINIDPNSLGSAEVILGPGSIIYGSDAIGGVMDFHTLKPLLSTSANSNFKFIYKSRYSTANNEIMNHANYNLGFSKLAFTGSISYSDFSDLKMGKNGSADYLCMEYADKQSNKDVIVKNPNPQKQVKSAYSQINFLQKIRYKASDNLDLLYSFHLSETSNIPRYDRLIQYKGDQLKYGEWYYGPQNLHLHSLQIKNSKTSQFYDSFKIISAYQNYKESRHNRKLNSSSLKSRNEKLHIFTLNVDAEKKIKEKFHLFYGTELSYNKLHSKGYSLDLESDKTEPISSRYPDNSTCLGLAFYSNAKWNINSKWTVNTGVRYSHIRIKSMLDKTFYSFPFENLNLSTGALNGGIGISHQSSKGWLLKLNATTGFRAPNIDDIGKVFDSEPGKVVVPNRDLKPEYVYNFEMNLSKKFANALLLEFNTFYSFLDNAMTRQDFSYNGESTMIYDGVESEIQAIVNADNAKVWGGNISAILKISDNFSANSSLTITKGEYKDGSPVRHVPPTFGYLSLNYKSANISSKLSLEFNDEISYQDLATSEQDKAYLYAKDKNGMPYSPAWVTINFRNQVQLTKRLSANLSIENILNKRYRPYSSGISAAGRNFIIGVSFHI